MSEYKPDLLKDSDFPSLMKLERESFPDDAWPEESMRKEIEDNREGFRVIREEDEVIAYVHTQVGYERLANEDVTGIETDGIIGSIAVSSSFRNRGLGEILMRAAIMVLKENGAGLVKLHTRESNHPMRRLGSKLGFSETSLLDNLYSDGEAGIEMHLPL